MLKNKVCQQQIENNKNSEIFEISPNYKGKIEFTVRYYYLLHYMIRRKTLLRPSQNRYCIGTSI